MSVRHCWVVCCVLLVAGVPTAEAQEDAQLQSPSAFLGYELGEQFTPHHRVVDYVRHVTAHSPAATVRQHGTTPEGRPLLLTTLTTPRNHERIDTIRRSNLKRAGQVDGTPQADVAVAWLSYNVHGDEPAPTEAALKTLHALADTSTARPDGVRASLENTVVLLDPCLNPDGRARYTQWFRETVGTAANPDPPAREHHPPWASGRTNHYYFDLNRDWAWGVQPETRARLNAYHRWMPNVHVDYHEMGVENPYYFAPGAEPYHENLTDWQRTFQETVGRHNARIFDRNGWLYFTKEVYDLLYPGYGDTWPLFNGAVGMTYEQGGGARAGRAVTTNGDTLTLAERLSHHHATALSTVEVVAAHRAEVLRAFATYHESAQEDPPGRYRTYVVHRQGEGGRVAALAQLLDRQHIQYEYVRETARVRGYSYREGTMERTRIQRGDLLVHAAQPKGRLVKVLFEPKTTVVDSAAYDITAWGLPYAYGVNAHAVPERVDVTTTTTPPISGSTALSADRPYAYAITWRSRADARFVGALLQAGVRLRVATKGFTVDDQSYETGTLLALRADNESPAFDDTVRGLARRHEQRLHALETGLTEQGPDLGASSVRTVDRPRVALLAGAPMRLERVGEVWHFFEQTIEYPVTLLPPDDFDASMLDNVDVLVLPDGDYDDWLAGARASAITRWVRNGGRLIALGDANAALAERPSYHLSSRTSSGAVRGDTTGTGARSGDETPSAPGSIHRVELDSSHPLTFGLDGPYFTLKRDTEAYTLSKADGWAAGALMTAAPVSGVMGTEAQQAVEGSVLFGTQKLGDGRVVYLVDNPLFRGFWYSGHVLFSNAVFMGGR
ncbi:MAG: zinc carboxypeptidase [Bacteroidetes bacterium SW_9_63_38]|nr:MAG: zinc carboxypeptidase [Bacteroidetes bacterium SW_9_63_38]